MARDVEQGQRRPRERPSAAREDDESTYASSSRGSSDGEGSQGGRAASKGTAEASSSAAVAAPPPPSAAASATFPAAALSRWFTPATAPHTPRKKIYDPLESTPVDVEDEDDEEAGGGIETVAAVERRLGAAAAARESLRRSRNRRCVLLSLLLLVSSALAATLSSPFWLSAALLRTPTTHELPYVLLEAAASEPVSSSSSSSSSSSLPAKRPKPSPSPSFIPRPREIVPRVIHQSWKTHVTPEKWDAARKSCADLHLQERGWQHRLWDDSELREAVAEAAMRIEAGSSSSSSSSHFDAGALMRAYDSYSNPVQRADISRYAVLFLHGGVYLDLDVRCERNLDAPELALLEKSIVLPRTWPVGISNDVIVAAPGNGLLELALRSAATAKKITSVLLFPSEYGKVMFSTGPMFLTITALRWPGRGEKLWIMPSRLYGKYKEKKKPRVAGRRAATGATAAAASSSTAAGCEGENKNGGSNRLHGAGAACGALFTHLHGSSWHGKDAALLAWVRGKGKAGSEGGGGGGGGGAAAAAGASAAAAAGVAAVVVARRVRARRREEEQKEQKEQQQQQQQQQLLQMQQQRRPPISQQQQQQQHPLFGKKRPPLVPAAIPSLSKQQ